MAANGWRYYPNDSYRGNCWATHASNFLRQLVKKGHYLLWLFWRKHIIARAVARGTKTVIFCYGQLAYVKKTGFHNRYQDQEVILYVTIETMLMFSYWIVDLVLSLFLGSGQHCPHKNSLYDNTS